MDERFDIDVSYRDPWEGGEDPFDPGQDRPHPSEYEDPLPPLPEDCDEPEECTCPRGVTHCEREDAHGQLARGGAEGSLYTRQLDDGREVNVFPMLFTFRLSVGSGGFVEDFYCYQRSGDALTAAVVWDGESDPLDGWVRHHATGRRRPEGDRAQEFVAP